MVSVCVVSCSYDNPHSAPSVGTLYDECMCNVVFM